MEEFLTNKKHYDIKQVVDRGGVEMTNRRDLSASFPLYKNDRKHKNEYIGDVSLELSFIPNANKGIGLDDHDLERAFDALILALRSKFEKKYRFKF